MAERADNERVNGHVYEDGAFALSGQHVLPPKSDTQIVLRVRSDGQQIVLPSVF